MTLLSLPLRLFSLWLVLVACLVGVALSSYGFFKARRAAAGFNRRKSVSSSPSRPGPPPSPPPREEPGEEPLLSVVVPVYNEEDAVALTLRRIERSCAERGCTELVVVDASSADATAERARAELGRCRFTGGRGAVLVSSGSGRGTALNEGARAARGALLLFVHADCRLPPGYDLLVRRALAPNAAEPAVGGAFSFAVDRRSFGEAGAPVGIGTMEAFANLRSRLFQLPYGDQAMFMTATRFSRLGRFPDQPFMEDFELTARLRRAALREGLRVAVLPERVLCSGRRWARNGVLKNTLLNQWFVFAYTTLGWSAADIYRAYYGESHKSA